MDAVRGEALLVSAQGLARLFLLPLRLTQETQLLTEQVQVLGSLGGNGDNESLPLDGALTRLGGRGPVALFRRTADWFLARSPISCAASETEFTWG